MQSGIRTRAALALGAVAVTVSLASCSPQAQAPTNTTAARATPTPSPPGTAASLPTESPVPAASPEAAAPTAVYADGQYSATGWYGGLPSHHDVILTIEGNAVTAVEITTPAEDETSLGYQQRFAEALPGAIVGRSIDEIAVDRLAGASGCSEGFMDALAKIKEQAAA